MFDVVGLSVAVNDEFPEVSMSADLITESRGKDGSVELLLGSTKFILDWQAAGLNCEALCRGS